MLTQPGTEHEPGECLTGQSVVSDHVSLFLLCSVFEGPAPFPIPSKRPDWILLSQNTFLPRSGMPCSTTVPTISPVLVSLFSKSLEGRNITHVAIIACPGSRPEAKEGTKACLTSDPGKPGTYTREDGSLALWFRRETGASVLPRALSTKHFARWPHLTLWQCGYTIEVLSILS